MLALIGYVLGHTLGRGRDENARGLALFNRGRHAEALAAFEAAIRRRDRVRYRLNAALARLWLFQVTEALRALEAIEGQQRGDATVKAHATQHAMLARALAGRITSADRAFSASDQHPYCVFLAGIHAMRDGDLQRADELFSTTEVRQLGGTQRAIADTLAAWCAHELRGDWRPIDRTALFGEAAPDGLFEVWPELQVFLERHEDQRSGGG